MKIGKYEKVTFRSAARLASLTHTREVCDAVMLDGGGLAGENERRGTLRKERARRLIIRIDTALMEHRIYQRAAGAPLADAKSKLTPYVVGTFGDARAPLF